MLEPGQDTEDYVPVRLERLAKTIGVYKLIYMVGVFYTPSSRQSVSSSWACGKHSYTNIWGKGKQPSEEEDRGSDGIHSFPADSLPW